MPDLQPTTYEDEALTALEKAQLFLVQGSDSESLVHAMCGVGFAVLHASAKPSVTEMVTHCAEHDHVLELRLIDTDVFGVRCTGERCSFRTEWRT